MSTLVDYRAGLRQRYWDYRGSHFSDGEARFDPRYTQDAGQPPVFSSREAWRNVIADPHASQDDVCRLMALVPEADRHKWFRSMNSSQALAQSVLGNLAIPDLLHCLTDLQDDEGLPLLGRASTAPGDFAMEYRVSYLGEPRSTSLDACFSGGYRVAIECKFTEAEFGSCSRPRLTAAESNYASGHCDGTYSKQRGRRERCPLTQSGVLYWRYVPLLFSWDADADLLPCPLYRNYQLVRNCLAAGVRPDGAVSLDGGHVLLIYDERNPAFQPGGAGLAAYVETRGALRQPAMLRRCSWQRITRHMRREGLLPWLTEHLALKYGL